MIYTVGINCSSPKFQKVDIKFLKNYFEAIEIIQYDSETTGFDAHIKDLMCIQLGTKENQFVVHPRYVTSLKSLLENKILIGHNLKFDLKFLYKYDIFPNYLYDTFLAESVLTCGYKTVKRGLASVVKNRLGVDLDKSVRDNIWEEGLTERVIEYSAEDVHYLEDVREQQLKELKIKDLTKTLELENEFVKVLAYIEYCGFKLDTQKWREKNITYEKQYKELKHKLDQFILTNNHTKYISFQGDLFSNDLSVTINWDSPKQVGTFFKELGIPVEIEEKEQIKMSVDSKNIQKYEKQFPIISDYLSYKETQKVLSTYGENFINQINTETGRIHTNFRQILDTGRISSGGKNKETKESYVNMQNLPSDKETRACFVAEAGNKLICADYSGQEQIVLANKCLDENLLKFYDEGLDDMHSFVASKMFPFLADLSLKEIKELHKDERQEAKIAGFIVNYGGAASNIADQLNKSIEDGNRVFESYFNAFPGLRIYFENERKKGVKNGYILISPETGRKSYIENFPQFLRLNKEITPQFWEKYKAEKAKYEVLEPNNFEAYREKVKNYFKIKGMIERKSLNFPIQGTSAEITKLSAIYFFNWIKENNYLKKVLINNQVHDENIVEAPENISQKVKIALEECMIKAGQQHCKRVPLKVDVHIADYWKK